MHVRGSQDPFRVIIPIGYYMAILVVDDQIKGGWPTSRCESYKCEVGGTSPCWPCEWGFVMPVEFCSLEPYQWGLVMSVWTVHEIGCCLS